MSLLRRGLINVRRLLYRRIDYLWGLITRSFSPSTSHLPFSLSLFRIDHSKCVATRGWSPSFPSHVSCATRINAVGSQTDRRGAARRASRSWISVLHGFLNQIQSPRDNPREIISDLRRDAGICVYRVIAALSSLPLCHPTAIGRGFERAGALPYR